MQPDIEIGNGIGSVQPAWLTILRPVAPCRLEPLIRGGETAWHVNVTFEQWCPPIDVKKFWKQTFGKKQIICEKDRLRTVAEMELVRRFRKAGWHAGFLSNYRNAPPEWVYWELLRFATDVEEAIIDPESLPLPIRAEAITAVIGPRGCGKPDIVAWQATSPAEVVSLAAAVFVEYKGPGDKVRPDQDAWFRAARHKGMSRDQFAVAQWRTPRRREQRNHATN